MSSFQPMVKMETTEPSVELKLKKGGKVAKKADGGMMGSPMSAAGAMPPSMPARGGMMGAKAPMKPSLAMRRRAMRGRPSGAGPAGPVGGAAQMQPSMPSAMPPMMKKGGKADTAQDKAMVKKAFKQHDIQEHKGGKGTKLSLKKGGKMATGGVTNGQGGFKSGGMTKKMATGGVVKGAAGYATGGVAKSNGGGYKKGGAPKKAYAAGGTVNSGRPVAMPQGNKKPSQPVKTNLVAGTFKRGGKVRKMAEGGDTISLNNGADRDRAYAEPKKLPEVALDFSQDPGFQAGPQATANDYESQLRLNTDQRRENQSDYYNQDNVDSYSRPMSIEFPFDASRQRIEPPPSSGLTELEKYEFDSKARNPDGKRLPMPGDGRPPMPGRVDETGRGYGSYLREPPVPPYYAQPYKAGGKVAPIKRMTGGRSVKC